MGRKRLRMGSSTEVRRAANRVANLVLNGELEARDANAILYAANVILGAIRVDDQRVKLEELERIVEELRR